MELLTEKIILLFVLFILGFVAGVGPYLLRNRCLSPSRFRDMLVSFLNCVSAGIFFATFFMHMMPEAQEEFSSVFSEVEYPFAEFLMSLGFFFVMFIEQAVMAWYGKKTKKPTDLDDCQIIENSHTSTANNVDSQKSLLKSLNNNANYNTLPDSVQPHSTTVYQDMRGSTSTAITDLGCSEITPPRKDSEDTSEVIGIEMSDMDQPQERHNHSDGNGGHVHFDPNAHSTIRSFVLLFALSAHALFEGLAIGFQTSAASLRTLVVAVVIHKMALAFSYGISLVTSKAKWRIMLVSMLIFSVMAPIGIGVGTGLTAVKNANETVEMVVAVMQAFAAGTFVYIIFIEIIPHEFVASSTDHRLPKILCLAVGFSIMAALQALPHEEE